LQEKQDASSGVHTDNTLLQNKKQVRSPHLTLEQLGAAVGRDASTLSRAADNIVRRLATAPELQDLLTEIERSLRPD
jgi:DNA polymerase I-like protein with 3'-5' exonuclease and polymerase domains